MARKATDLLDVFRFADDGDGGTADDAKRGGGAKGRAKKGGATKRKAAANRSGFDGLILTKRQVILGASVCCLVVALSFVLGLSAGRPDTDTPAASRTAATGRVVIRGVMPAVHPATQNPLDPAALHAELVREYQLPAGNLRVRRVGGQLYLEIGLFDSKAQAEEFLRDRGLDMAHLYGADPFTTAAYITVGE